MWFDAMILKTSTGSSSSSASSVSTLTFRAFTLRGIDKGGNGWQASPELLAAWLR